MKSTKEVDDSTSSILMHEHQSAGTSTMQTVQQYEREMMYPCLLLHAFIMKNGIRFANDHNTARSHLLDEVSMKGLIQRVSAPSSAHARHAFAHIYSLLFAVLTCMDEHISQAYPSLFGPQSVAYGDVTVSHECPCDISRKARQYRTAKHTNSPCSYQTSDRKSLTLTT